MFNFANRINRTRFAAEIIVSAILFYTSILILDWVGEDGQTAGNLAGILMFVLLAAEILFLACVTRQRANDISGKHPLLLFALAWMTPAMLLLFMLPGQSTPNRYGAPTISAS